MQHVRLVVVTLAVLVVAVPAYSQGAKASGTVREIGGRPLKGATVRAINRDASPPEITSATDDKGRWAMLGLRSGTWTFIVEAPGYSPVRADAPIRVSGTPPLNFALARDPGPIPGALDRNVLQLVTAANALRDNGQYAQALSAYQEILAQNPKLTSINFVMAGVYRKQASGAADPSARRALLDRALEAYGPLLKNDATVARAQAEIDATHAEIQALSR